MCAIQKIPQLEYVNLLPQIGFEEQIQVVRLAGECPYPLSHLCQPKTSIKKIIFQFNIKWSLKTFYAVKHISVLGAPDRARKPSVLLLHSEDPIYQAAFNLYVL